MLTVERTVQEALVAIDGSWDAWPTIPERIVEVLSRTLDGCAVAIHHWHDADIEFDAHSFDRHPREIPWVANGGVRKARFYDPRQPGRDADRVVTGQELQHRNPSKWTQFQDGFLSPMELGDQARALVTDDDGRLLAFVGAYPQRGRGATETEIAILEQLLQPITQRLRTWKLMAQTSTERAAILDLVCEMREPGFVISGDGTLLLANDAARLAYDRPPEWLCNADILRSPPSWLRTITVTDGARRVYVCIPRGDGVKLERIGLLAAKRWGLPARLHGPAAKVIAGRTDKEIARETGLSHSTVRTYIQLVYRHVGVSSRTALAREALRVLYR